MPMAVPAKRPCDVVSFCGTSTVMCCELSPHRDLAISTNPGGSAFCLWVGDGLATWGATVGFSLHKLWAAAKEPWVWALLFLLQLYSQELAGSSDSNVQEDVIFTQCEGASLLRTCSSVNAIRSSMASLSSCTHSTN